MSYLLKEWVLRRFVEYQFMTKRQLVTKEIQKMPEPLLEKVFDFVQFLKVKNKKQKMTSAFLSESALQKDWLRPEEEKAWKNL